MLAEMKMSGSQNYLSIIEGNSDNAKLTLGTDDRKTIFITSDNVSDGEISYLEMNRPIDLGYSINTDRLNLYDSAQSQTGSVGISIAEEGAFASDLEELPSLAKREIIQGANPVFLNSDTLDYILEKGGLSSIWYDNGNLLSSSFPNYVNLFTSGNELSQNPQDLTFLYLSADPVSDGASLSLSLTIDDSAEVYVALPDSSESVDILNSFVGDYATAGIKPRISTDGKIHASTVFLLDYEIVSANISNCFTAFTPCYGSGFFPSKALMTPLPIAETIKEAVTMNARERANTKENHKTRAARMSEPFAPTTLSIITLLLRPRQRYNDIKTRLRTESPTMGQPMAVKILVIHGNTI